MIIEDLRDLMGKRLTRGDVMIRVKSVSIGLSKTIYIHSGSPDISFGWTYRNSDGSMCGKWVVVIEGVEFQRIPLEDICSSW